MVDGETRRGKVAVKREKKIELRGEEEGDQLRNFGEGEEIQCRKFEKGNRMKKKS